MLIVLKVFAVERECEGPVLRDNVNCPAGLLDIRTPLHPCPALVLLAVVTVRVCDRVEAFSSIFKVLLEQFNMKLFAEWVRTSGLFTNLNGK